MGPRARRVYLSLPLCAALSVAGSPSTPGSGRQPSQVAADAPGELAILLDSLDLLLQHSRVLGSTAARAPASPSMPESHQSEYPQGGGPTAVHSKGGGESGDRASRSMGGHEPPCRVGGGGTAMDDKELAAEGGEVSLVGDGLRWGFEALQAVVRSGACEIAKSYVDLLCQPETYVSHS